MVRVIESNDHDFIGRITMYQNSYNPVKKRDFKSNDPIQVRLKRELALKGYYYDIKRGEEFDTLRNKYPYMNSQYIHNFSNELIAKLLAGIKIGPDIAAGKGSEVFFGEQYENLFEDSTTSYQIITPWILRRIIRSTYRASTKSFHEFDKPHDFKNRALFYVLRFIYDFMKGRTNSDWEKKLVHYWDNTNWADWGSFQKDFAKIINPLFEIVYKGYKKSGESYHNTYLQSADTLKEIVKENKDTLDEYKIKTREIFDKFVN